jgi:DNA polymerase-1
MSRNAKTDFTSGAASGGSSATPASNYERTQEENIAELEAATRVPDPPPELFYGPLGRVALAMGQVTEFDPAGLYASLLCCFGNAVSQAAFICRGEHFFAPIEYVALVGPTSAARKSSALRAACSLIADLEPSWKSRIRTDAASGEWIIEQIRDAEFDSKQDKKTGDWSEVMIHPGVADKRLLIRYEEMATLMIKATRKGNTLVDCLRQGWDCIPLTPGSKSSPARVEHPRLSVLTASTPEDLRIYCPDEWKANGTLNRFLWMLLKPMPFIPDGGPKIIDHCAQDAAKLKSALQRFTQTSGRRSFALSLAPDFNALWNQLYPDLVARGPYKVTHRSEAHAMRVAIILALADNGLQLKPAHLAAASLLVSHSNRCAEAIFHPRKISERAYEIVEYLRNRGANGASRKQIRRDVFHDNLAAADLTVALQETLDAGLTRKEGERPEIWYAIDKSGGHNPGGGSNGDKPPTGDNSPGPSTSSTYQARNEKRAPNQPPKPREAPSTLKTLNSNTENKNSENSLHCENLRFLRASPLLENEIKCKSGNIKDLENATEGKRSTLNATCFERALRASPGRLALDLETAAEVKVSRRGASKVTTTAEALDPWTGEIRLVTLADEAGNLASYDLRELGGKLPDEIRAAIERSTAIVHNALFDLLFLKVRLGIVPAKVFCTLTAARLLTPCRDVSHKLGAIIERYLGVKLPKEHGGSDWGSFILTDDQLAYARDDVRHLHALAAKLGDELKAAGLEAVFDLEMALIPIIVKMEDHGFAVDGVKLEELQADADGKAVKLADSVRKEFRAPTLNPGSPPQLLAAFKAARVELDNTNEATLVACKDPRAKLILDYREQAKLGSSIEGLLKAVRADGRIHARFKPTGTKTGRFSSSDPNLQNITRGPLRSCFVPSAPDRCLIVADFSQIELRVAAYFAGDEFMLAAFRAENKLDRDLHCQTAAAVLSKSPEHVTKADRQLAKAVNFGFLYGQSAKGFQEYARTVYGILLSLEKAAELRDKFFARYTGLAKWHSDAWRKAENGIAENHTIIGRRLMAQGDQAWDRFQAHTNYVVQGSAADVVKEGMVEVDAILPTDVYLIASVHDELIYDAPMLGASELCQRIRVTMEAAFTKLFGPELPIEVEANVVSSWGEKK